MKLHRSTAVLFAAHRVAARTAARSAMLVLALAGSACSPSLDWRDVRPAGSGAQVLFPCKPEVNSRPVTREQPGRMGLASCKAGGLSFSLAWAEVANPAQVTPALRQMRVALLTKLAAKPTPLQPLQVSGMTPNPEVGTQRLEGSAKAGSQQAQVALFTRGLWVYQAVMLGDKRDDNAWSNFADSIKLDF
jgi:hypothetical protein